MPKNRIVSILAAGFLIGAVTGAYADTTDVK